MAPEKNFASNIDIHIQCIQYSAAQTQLETKCLKYGEDQFDEKQYSTEVICSGPSEIFDFWDNKTEREEKQQNSNIALGL